MSSKKIKALFMFVSLMTMTGCKVELGLLQNLPLTQANLAWNFPSHHFGQQPVGTTTTHTFTLTNSGIGTAQNCGSVEISDTTNFTITNSTCVGDEFAPGASCSVDIDFHPQNLGPLFLTIKRTCLSTVSNTIQLEGVASAKVKIVGSGFGDLATAEAYVNSFKVGDPVTDVDYDSGTDTFEFVTDENSDFSKINGFMGGVRRFGTFEDPHNLIKVFSPNSFNAITGKTYELKDITVNGGVIFSGASQSSIKIEKYTCNHRVVGYAVLSTFEFDDLIASGDQPKFIFNESTNIIVNNDFRLMVGTHGWFTEFSDLNTSNAWTSNNTYDFKGDVIFDNSKNIVTGAATKIFNATFYFRKNFNIVNMNGLRIFKTVGLTHDNIRGINHVYFYGNIGDTEGADFPVGTLGTTNVVYHVLAAKQTSNAGAVEGDLQNIMTAGGTVLFDL